MKRRIIALVAALLLAGAGTFVLVSFVRSAEDRATAGQEMVTVYVIQAEIPKGTEGELVPGFIEAEERPLSTRPANAVTNPASLAGFVAAVDLLVGEVLVDSRWVPPTEADLRRDDLPDRRVEVPTGHLEIPIRLDTEQALGGIIDAGDTVAIVASFDAFTAEEEDTTLVVEDGVIAIPDSVAEEEPEQVQATHILIHNALVVEVQAEAVPMFTAEEGSAVLAPSTGFIITFALEPTDVERLVFAASYGRLWLASQTDDDAGATAIVTIENIFEGT